jgi:hypothetical protein
VGVDSGCVDWWVDRGSNSGEWVLVLCSVVVWNVFIDSNSSSQIRRFCGLVDGGCRNLVSSLVGCGFVGGWITFEWSGKRWLFELCVRCLEGMCSMN